MVNSKTIAKRTYYPDGYRKRAACVCVKDEAENEILLVTCRKNKNNWGVPGGGVEDNEEPFRAAHREVFEEAGVKGVISRCLGIFENCDRKHRTTVYVLLVAELCDDWEDARGFGRRRKWFSLNEALAALDVRKATQKGYLNSLKSFASIGDRLPVRNHNHVIDIAPKIGSCHSNSHSGDPPACPSTASSSAGSVAAANDPISGDHCGGEVECRRSGVTPSQLTGASFSSSSSCCSLCSTVSSSQLDSSARRVGFEDSAADQLSVTTQHLCANCDSIVNTSKNRKADTRLNNLQCDTFEAAQSTGSSDSSVNQSGVQGPSLEISPECVNEPENFNIPVSSSNNCFKEEN